MLKRFAKILYIVAVFNLLFLHPSPSFAADYDGLLISGIGISGNYPYIENKIRRYLTILPGNPYHESDMNNQIVRIKQFYKREGWFDTVVTVRPEHIEDFNSVYLHFKIKRGFLLRYRNINVTGDYSLPTSLVATKINPWKQYTPRKLRESIHKITNVYRKEGYPLARVKVIDKKEDLEKHRIDVTVRIDEGPYVTVNFKGNKHLGGKQLMNVVTLFEEGAIDSYELDESTDNIKKRYIQRGFPNAKIKYTRKEISKDYISIIFHIDEGKPERIRSIAIEGNEEISSGKIKDNMLSKSLSLLHPGIYDEKVLGNDTKRITYFYKSKGFLEEITDIPYIEKVENGTQLNIIIPVSEGSQTIVKSINFMGDTIFEKDILLKNISSKEGKFLNYNNFDDQKDALLGYYADNGYPYAEIDLDVVHLSPSEADLNFNIKPGPKVSFGEITITGDFLTSQKAINTALNIKEGDTFSYEKLAKGKISLRRLGAFATADVDTVGMEEKATVVPINVRVQELRPFRLDFDIGYSTDENFVGSIDFVNRNAFGWAKRAIFRLTGGKKLSRGEVGWIDPRIGGTDLELSSNGWLQYEDKQVFTYIQAGAGAGLYRRYHRTSFLVRTAIERNYFLKGSSTAADAESLRNNTIISTSASLSWDTRNNFAYPTKGLFAMGYINFFNEIRGKNAHFVKFGLNHGIYYTFGGRFTLANEIKFDNIQTFEKNTSVPSNELLLLGGDNNLRGFDRNSLGPVNALGAPTGGRLRFVDSTELRVGLFGNFKFVAFHDMGFLTNSYHAVTLGQLRHSAGLGINYITPIGPISAVYGFIIDRNPGEHIGRFHLQFGYTF